MQKSKFSRNMRINWFLLGTVLLLAILETAYFGWNLYPKSRAEMVMDMLCFVLFLQCVARREGSGDANQLPHTDWRLPSKESDEYFAKHNPNIVTYDKWTKPCPAVTRAARRTQERT